MKKLSPVVIIDYGMGNTASVLNMIRFIGGNVKISSSPEEIKSASKLILPGVGSFDAGVNSLSEAGLDSAIYHAVNKEGSVILGICLGMQLLMDSSEEGDLSGLGLVPGKVRRFDIKNQGLRVPHMGWNVVNLTRDSLLFNLNGGEQRFYFVHSYYAECKNHEDITGLTNYGNDFISAFEHDNILGVQFHPEKSHRYGMNLLLKFLEV